jgi:hypothetical protein
MLITKNGNYKLTQQTQIKAVSSVVYVSGTLGPATVAITYLDDLGNFVPLTDGTVTAAGQYAIDHGYPMQLFLSVSGADVTTNIAVTITSKG